MTKTLKIIKKVEPSALDSVKKLVSLGFAKELTGLKEKMIELVASNMKPSSEPTVTRCMFSCDNTYYSALFKFTPMATDEGYFVGIEIVKMNGQEIIDVNHRHLHYVPLQGFRKREGYPEADLTTYLIGVATRAYGESEQSRVRIGKLDYDSFRNTYSRNILCHKSVPMEYIIKDKSWLMDMKGYHDIDIYYNATDDATYHGAVVAGIVVLNGEAGNKATQQEVREVFRYIVKDRIEDYYAGVADAIEAEETKKDA